MLGDWTADLYNLFRKYQRCILHELSLLPSGAETAYVSPIVCHVTSHQYSYKNSNKLSGSLISIWVESLLCCPLCPLQDEHTFFFSCLPRKSQIITAQAHAQNTCFEVVAALGGDTVFIKDGTLLQKVGKGGEWNWRIFKASSLFQSTLM